MPEQVGLFFSTDQFFLAEQPKKCDKSISIHQQILRHPQDHYPLFNNWQRSRLICGIPAHKSIITQIPLSQHLTSKEALQHLKRHLSKTMHLPCKKIYFDYSHAFQTKPTDPVTVVACKKEGVQSLLDQLKLLQLKPRAIDHPLTAVHRLLRHFKQPDTLIIYQTKQMILAVVSAENGLSPIIHHSLESEKKPLSVLVPWFHQLERQPTHQLLLAEKNRSPIEDFMDQFQGTIHLYLTPSQIFAHLKIISGYDENKQRECIVAAGLSLWETS